MQPDLLNLIIARIDKLDTHLDRAATHLARVDVTLAKQSILLEEHIKRTNLLEDRLEGEIVQQADTLSPIKKHVEGVGFLIKFVGILGTIVGLVTAIYKIMGY